MRKRPQRPHEPTIIPLDAEPQNRDWLRQLAEQRGGEPPLEQILDALKRPKDQQRQERPPHDDTATHD